MNNNSEGIREVDCYLIQIKGIFRFWKVKQAKYGKHKLVFSTKDKLMPANVIDWKVKFTSGEEIMLPAGSCWVITFTDTDDIITSLPCKQFEDGEWAVFEDLGKEYATAYIYQAGSNWPLAQYIDESYARKRAEEERIKTQKKAAKARKKWSKLIGSSDDEDDIMRAIGSGDGDIFGL